MLRSFSGDSVADTLGINSQAVQVVERSSGVDQDLWNGNVGIGVVAFVHACSGDRVDRPFHRAGSCASGGGEGEPRLVCRGRVYSYPQVASFVNRIMIFFGLRVAASCGAERVQRREKRDAKE